MRIDFTLVLVWAIFQYCDARCCRNKPLQCYVCDSRVDKNCNDPFNYALDPKVNPPVVDCNGCCVKLVQYAYTKNETIRRMCTTDLHINMFMVGAVCMKEKSGAGHMCFCEEYICNKAPNIHIRYPTIFVLPLLALILI